MRGITLMILPWLVPRRVFLSTNNDERCYELALSHRILVANVVLEAASESIFAHLQRDLS
jgi:hypothetical protein